MGVPPKLKENGKRMTEVYFNLFIFENHFRNFIEEVSIKAYGKDYWDYLIIKKEVKRNVNRRIEKEGKHKWVSLRGNSKLFYTDFDDLRKIIISNWEQIFKEFFPKQTWISSRLEDLYELRNRIAHNIPIEENERITVQSIINNIYKQLDVNLEYDNLFREDITQMIIDEDEEFYQEGEESFVKLEEIDFDLIFNYLEMIEKGEIPDENLNNTLNAIDREIVKVSRIEKITQKDIVKLDTICNHLIDLIKIKDERFEYLIIGVLHSFTFNDKTSAILRSQGYSYLAELIQQENYDPNLIRILDKFEYFNDKLEALILKAIRHNGIGQLNIFMSNLDFSRYKDQRIDIIRNLNQMLLDIEPSNLNLKEAVKNIIRKFE